MRLDDDRDAEGGPDRRGEGLVGLEREGARSLDLVHGRPLAARVGEPRDPVDGADAQADGGLAKLAGGGDRRSARSGNGRPPWRWGRRGGGRPPRPGRSRAPSSRASSRNRSGAVPLVSSRRRWRSMKRASFAGGEDPRGDGHASILGVSRPADPAEDVPGLLPEPGDLVRVVPELGGEPEEVGLGEELSELFPERRRDAACRRARRGGRRPEPSRRPRSGGRGARGSPVRPSPRPSPWSRPARRRGGRPRSRGREPGAGGPRPSRRPRRGRRERR